MRMDRLRGKVSRAIPVITMKPKSPTNSHGATTRRNPPQHQLSQDEIAALWWFKDNHAHEWKAELRKMWASAWYPHVPDRWSSTLHELRNASYFGPSGLERFRLRYPVIDGKPLTEREIKRIRKMAERGRSGTIVTAAGYVDVFSDDQCAYVNAFGQQWLIPLVE